MGTRRTYLVMILGAVERPKLEEVLRVLTAAVRLRAVLDASPESGQERIPTQGDGRCSGA